MNNKDQFIIFHLSFQQHDNDEEKNENNKTFCDHERWVSEWTREEKEREKSFALTNLQCKWEIFLWINENKLRQLSLTFYSERWDLNKQIFTDFAPKWNLSNEPENNFFPSPVLPIQPSPATTMYFHYKQLNNRNWTL
jgi:hypothetical protein